MKSKIFAAAFLFGAFTFNSFAWDYEGHHAVNELALASLPSDFGGFEMTPALKGRVAFLAGEPDRWRNVSDLALKHENGPNHYIDLEDIALCGLTPETLPPLRYDFVADIVRARIAHPENFPKIDLAKDADHTRELDGFLPWEITEDYEKLKSDFATLKTLREYNGTAVEIANAEADCIYDMGVMGHYVGDGSQPLHTTKYFNGWIGENTNGFTTRTTFHAWIDGGYFKKTGGIKVENLVGKIVPAINITNANEPNGIFRDVVAYIVEQNKLVEPLYQLDKDGELSGNGEKGSMGRAFLDNQLVKAGQMLGNLWLTAWQDAPKDAYLQRQLQQRSKS